MLAVPSSFLYVVFPVAVASLFIIVLTSSPVSTFTSFATSPKENWVLKLYFNLPFMPFLVVIIITPLDALEPYNAVAEASFKTLIDSISLGLMVFKRLAEPAMPLLSTGTPSITIKGSLPALNEEPPRIRILLPPPAYPPPEVICSPATLPCNNCSEEGINPF